MRKKIRFLIFILLTSTVTFVGFTFLLEKLLIKDISVDPISSRASPDFQASRFEYRPGVYLISYADGSEVFFKNQNALAASALNKGFDFILNYRRSHLDPKFVKQNFAILNQKKGAGFWLWKPWIILRTLETVPEDAIVVYMDSGVLFRNSVTPLIELATDQEIILFEYDIEEYWGKPINVTKREIFIALDCDNEICHQGKHVWAGAAVFRNTVRSRAFVKEWLDHCMNEKLLTDALDPSVQQYPNFVRQYHDEAILNTLYNKYPEGKYLFPAKTLFQRYATWHHRHASTEHYSLLMANHNNRPSWIYIMQNDLLNNYLTVLFRKIYAAFRSKESDGSS